MLYCCQLTSSAVLCCSAVLCNSLLRNWLKPAMCYKSHEHRLLYTFYIHRPRLPPNHLIPILHLIRILLISALILIKDQYRYSLNGLISIHTFSPRGLRNLRYGSWVVMKLQVDFYGVSRSQSVCSTIPVYRWCSFQIFLCTTQIENQTLIFQQAVICVAVSPGSYTDIKTYKELPVLNCLFSYMGSHVPCPFGCGLLFPQGQTESSRVVGIHYLLTGNFDFTNTHQCRLVRHHCGLQATVVTRRWSRSSWQQGPTLTYRKQ